MAVHYAQAVLAAISYILYIYALLTALEMNGRSYAQAVLAAISYILYIYALLTALDTPQALLLLGKEKTCQSVPSELDPRWLLLYFVMGTVVWVLWIFLLRGLLLIETELLRPHAHRFWAKLSILILGAPGLSLFPVLSVYLSGLLTDGVGALITMQLAGSSFFLELMFVQDQDFGMVDMLQAVHLGILGKFTEKKMIMILISFIYYGRKFIVLFAQEIVKARRRRRQQQQNVPQDDSGARAQLEQLVLEVDQYVIVARGDARLTPVLAAAYDRGEIDYGTVLTFNRSLNMLSSRAGIARRYLENNH